MALLCTGNWDTVILWQLLEFFMKTATVVNTVALIFSKCQLFLRWKKSHWAIMVAEWENAALAYEKSLNITMYSIMCIADLKSLLKALIDIVNFPSEWWIPDVNIIAKFRLRLLPPPKIFFVFFQNRTLFTTSINVIYQPRYFLTIF